MRAGPAIGLTAVAFGLAAAVFASVGQTDGRGSGTTAGPSPSRASGQTQRDLLRVRFGPAPRAGQRLALRVVAWATTPQSATVRIHRIRSTDPCPSRSVQIPTESRLISIYSSTGRVDVVHPVPLARRGRYRVCVYLETAPSDTRRPTRRSTVIASAGVLVPVR